MDSLSIHHRYEIRDYLGGEEKQPLLTAYDSRGGQNVFCSLLMVSEKSSLNSLKDYYQQQLLFSSSQEGGAYSLLDFGEYPISEMGFLKKYLGSEFLIQRPTVFYFIYPQDNRKLLLESKQYTSSKELATTFFRATAALYSIHEKRIFAKNISPWTIVCDSTGQVDFLNLGVFPPSARWPKTELWHSPEISSKCYDIRSDLYALAVSFCYYVVGKNLQTENLTLLQDTLEKKGVETPFAQILIKCLAEKPNERPSSTKEVLHSLSNFVPLEVPNFRSLPPLRPTLSPEVIPQDLGFTIQNLNEPKYLPRRTGYFFDVDAGKGRSHFLSSVLQFSQQNGVETLSVNFLMNSGILLPPLLTVVNQIIPEMRKNISFTGLYPSSLEMISDAYLRNLEDASQKIMEEIPRSLVVILDNIQLASKDSLRYIEQMIRIFAIHIQQKLTPKVIFVACGDSKSSPELQGFYGRISQDENLSEMVQVGQMQSSCSSRDVVVSSLGLESAPEIFTRKLSQITKDHPLFSFYTLATLIKKKILYLEDGDWYMEADSVDDLPFPMTIEESIANYLGTFSPIAQDLLHCLSEVGTSVSWHFISNTFASKRNELWITLWQLYAEQLIDIHQDFSITFRHQSTANYLKSLLQRKKLSFNYPLVTLKQSTLVSDRFLLVFLMLKTRKYEEAAPYFCEVLATFLNVGFAGTVKNWCETFPISQNFAAKYMTFIGETLFLCDLHSLSQKYFQKAPLSPLSLLRRTQIALQSGQHDDAREFFRQLNKMNDCPELYQIYILRLKIQLDKPSSSNTAKSWKQILKILEKIWKNKSLEKVSIFAWEFYCDALSCSEIYARFDFSLQWFAAGKKQAESFQNTPVTSKFYLELGEQEKLFGNYSDALESFQKSYDIAEKFSYPTGKARALIAIANTYLEVNNLSPVPGMITRSTQICEQYGLVKELGCCYQLQARVLYGERSEEVILFFEKAISLLRQSQCFKNLALVIMDLAKFCPDYDNLEHLLKELEEIVASYPLPFLQVGLLELEIQRSTSEEETREKIAVGTDLAQKYNLKVYHWAILYHAGIAYRSFGQMEQSVEFLQSAWHIIEGTAEKLPAEFRLQYLEGEILQEISDILSTLTTELPLENLLAEFQKEVEEDSLVRLREENENLHKLLELNKKINQEHDLRRLLDLIMDTAIEITNAERGFLILTSTKDGKLFEVARNFEREDITNPQFEISHSITEKVIRTGLPILSRDALEEFDGYQSVSELKLHSVLAVPLRVKQKVTGALYIDNRFEKAVFSDKHKSVLEAFADQAAIAIANTNLISENRKKQKDLEITQKQVEELNQELEVLNARLARKVESQKEELREVKSILQNKYQYSNIIGRSKPMQDMFQILKKVADKNIPVFIHGESGTGKELVARAIHFSGNRRDKGFLSINCAAINDTLLESELFGHVKGAFTGAYMDKKGFFELADGGTLFLDEVGDMSPSMQASLLRVLETNQIRPVGGKDKVDVNVRIISASNKDLKTLASKGEFREDLFFRLKVVQVNLPPLRERKEDIPLLVNHFLEEYAKENSISPRTIAKGGLKALMDYDWPGNIRELRNVQYRVLSLYDDLELNEKHFQDLSPSSSIPKGDLFTQEMSIDEYAKCFVEARQNKYNDSQLARILGFSRKTLWEKRKKWNLYRNQNSTEK